MRKLARTAAALALAGTAFAAVPASADSIVYLCVKYREVYFFGRYIPVFETASVTLNPADCEGQIVIGIPPDLPPER